MNTTANYTFISHFKAITAYFFLNIYIPYLIVSVQTLAFLCGLRPFLAGYAARIMDLFKRATFQTQAQRAFQGVATKC